MRRWGRSPMAAIMRHASRSLDRTTAAPRPADDSPYHGPMKIGLVLPMNDTDGPGAGAWPRLKKLARLAETGGIDSLWLYDHLIFRFPDKDEDGIHEAMSLLAAVA